MQTVNLTIRVEICFNIALKETLIMVQLKPLKPHTYLIKHQSAPLHLIAIHLNCIAFQNMKVNTHKSPLH